MFSVDLGSARWRVLPGAAGLPGDTRVGATVPGALLPHPIPQSHPVCVSREEPWTISHSLCILQVTKPVKNVTCAALTDDSHCWGSTGGAEGDAGVLAGAAGGQDRDSRAVPWR